MKKPDPSNNQQGINDELQTTGTQTTGTLFRISKRRGPLFRKENKDNLEQNGVFYSLGTRRIAYPILSGEIRVTSQVAQLAQHLCDQDALRAGLLASIASKTVPYHSRPHGLFAQAHGQGMHDLVRQ